jgi:hypothetical protein
MGLTDDLSEGVATIAREVQKAIEQGKGKVEQLQLERRMDAAARKLGYLELDRSRGRAVDETVRQDLLQQLATLEDQLVAVQNAKKAAEEQAAAATAPADVATAPADATTAPADATTAPEYTAAPDTTEATPEPPAVAGV